MSSALDFYNVLSFLHHESEYFMGITAEEEEDNTKHIAIDSRLEFIIRKYAEMRKSAGSDAAFNQNLLMAERTQIFTALTKAVSEVVANCTSRDRLFSENYINNELIPLQERIKDTDLFEAFIGFFKDGIFTDQQTMKMKTPLLVKTSKNPVGTVTIPSLHGFFVEAFRSQTINRLSGLNASAPSPYVPVFDSLLTLLHGKYTSLYESIVKLLQIETGTDKANYLNDLFYGNGAELHRLLDRNDTEYAGQFFTQLTSIFSWNSAKAIIESISPDLEIIQKARDLYSSRNLARKSEDIIKRDEYRVHLDNQKYFLLASYFQNTDVASLAVSDIRLATSEDFYDPKIFITEGVKKAQKRLIEDGYLELPDGAVVRKSDSENFMFSYTSPSGEIIETTCEIQTADYLRISSNWSICCEEHSEDPVSFVEFRKVYPAGMDIGKNDGLRANDLQVRYMNFIKDICVGVSRRKNGDSFTEEPLNTTRCFAHMADMMYTEEGKLKDNNSGIFINWRAYNFHVGLSPTNTDPETGRSVFFARTHWLYAQMHLKQAVCPKCGVILIPSLENLMNVWGYSLAAYLNMAKYNPLFLYESSPKIISWTPSTEDAMSAISRSINARRENDPSLSPDISVDVFEEEKEGIVNITLQDALASNYTDMDYFEKYSKISNVPEKTSDLYNYLIEMCKIIFKDEEEDLTPEKIIPDLFSRLRVKGGEDEFTKIYPLRPFSDKDTKLTKFYVANHHIFKINSVIGMMEMLLLTKDFFVAIFNILRERGNENLIANAYCLGEVYNINSLKRVLESLYEVNSDTLWKKRSDYEPVCDYHCLDDAFEDELSDILSHYEDYLSQEHSASDLFMKKDKRNLSIVFCTDENDPLYNTIPKDIISGVAALFTKPTWDIRDLIKYTLYFLDATICHYIKADDTFSDLYMFEVGEDVDKDVDTREYSYSGCFNKQYSPDANEEESYLTWDKFTFDDEQEPMAKEYTPKNILNSEISCLFDLKLSRSIHNRNGYFPFHKLTQTSLQPREVLLYNAQGPIDDNLKAKLEDIHLPGLDFYYLMGLILKLAYQSPENGLRRIQLQQGQAAKTTNAKPMPHNFRYTFDCGYNTLQAFCRDRIAYNLLDILVYTYSMADMKADDYDTYAGGLDGHFSDNAFIDNGLSIYCGREPAFSENISPKLDNTGFFSITSSGGDRYQAMDDTAATNYANYELIAGRYTDMNYMAEKFQILENFKKISSAKRDLPHLKDKSSLLNKFSDPFHDDSAFWRCFLKYWDSGSKSGKEHIASIITHIDSTLDDESDLNPTKERLKQLFTKDQPLDAVKHFEELFNILIENSYYLKNIYEKRI